MHYEDEFLAKTSDVETLPDVQDFVLGKDGLTYAVRKRDGDTLTLSAIRWIKFTKDSKFSKTTAGKTALKVDETTRELAIYKKDPTHKNLYQKDKVTGHTYLTEDKSTVRLKHALLLIFSIPVIPIQILACTVTMVYLAVKVLTCANAFPGARVYQKETFLQAQARDIARIAAAPFAMIVFIFNPIYGMMNPFGARKVYGNLESFVYGHTLFAGCMQPQLDGFKRTQIHVPIKPLDMLFNAMEIWFYKLEEDPQKSKVVDVGMTVEEINSQFRELGIPEIKV
jgi:hypothetical protein